MRRASLLLVSSYIAIHLLTFPHSTSIQYEVVARATMEANDSSIEGGTVRATMKSPICKIVILILHMALFLSPLMRRHVRRGKREEEKNVRKKEKVSATAVEREVKKRDYLIRNIVIRSEVQGVM